MSRDELLPGIRERASTRLADPASGRPASTVFPTHAV